jgi:hypothetical protein
MDHGEGEAKNQSPVSVFHWRMFSHFLVAGDGE